MNHETYVKCERSVEQTLARICEFRGIDRSNFRFAYNCVIPTRFWEYSVSVYHDRERNALVKFQNGEITDEMEFPRNWTDKERNDGRNWTLNDVHCHFPEDDLNLHWFTPYVEVVFRCRRTGKIIVRKF